MSTTTRTQTNTATHAKRVASKIVTDLYRMKIVHNITSLTDEEIKLFELEAGILLSHGLLKEVIYGLIRNEKWVVAVKYTVINGQLNPSGDDPGGLRPGANTYGTNFSSVLIYSGNPSANDLRNLNLPFERTTIDQGYEVENGRWTNDKKYTSGDIGVSRDTIKRY